MRATLLVALPLIASCLLGPSTPVVEKPTTPPRDQTLDALRSTVVLFHDVPGSDPAMKCAGVLLKNLVITAAHCAPDGAVLSLQTYDMYQTSSATYVPVTRGLFKEAEDIALLFPTAVIPGPYHTATLAPEAPAAGAKVVLIGHPLKLTYTITEGIVSNGKRRIDGVDWLHASILMTSGNSGGPLFNRFGELVGVASFGLVSSGKENHLSMFVHLDTIKKEL